MSHLGEILLSLEAKAKAALAAAEADGKQLVQRLLPVLEDGFTRVVEDFGQLACTLVVNFCQQEFEALTGGEKHGQVVIHLIQQAELQGKALAVQDAQALAKQAFLAILDQGGS